MSRGRQYVYDFAAGAKGMRDLLGGKGANVAEMTRILGPERVPEGFVTTTEACAAYLRGGELPPEARRQFDAALGRLEERAEQGLGDADAPLLVSVRSGAPVSMPGMMDTVLNLGTNRAVVAGIAKRTANARFAWDSYRRFLQMFGNVVQGIPSERYERLIAEARRAEGVEDDSALGPAALEELAGRMERLFAEEAGEPFPSDPRVQLEAAVHAVFDSWNAPRARSYRRLNGIPNDLGTAVTVQRMVFGNTGPRSGSGVAFSRDAITGAPAPSGDFLQNAQGEDVVAGVRNTQELGELARLMPEVHAELLQTLQRLERSFGDMQDVEFTVEEGRLFILQTRAAKRHPQGAIRFAVDAVAEGLLDEPAALMTIDAESTEALLHPTFDPDAGFEVLARGIGASPGAARGRLVFSAKEAVASAAEGADVILVRPFTEADDVAGFDAARGILTSAGGRASHAALVARGMGRPCVAGAAEVKIDVERRELRVGDRTLGPDDSISIDGSAGVVTADAVPLRAPEITGEFERVLAWADGARHLEVRANADTPADAKRARELGARGIGLCRTEHMFFGADRDRLVRELFLTAERARRGIGEEGGFDAALASLKELQRRDFEQILEITAPDPVTVRLLDPPLHEFLPVAHFERAVERGEGDRPGAELEADLELARELEEVNPMLGTRGARLGILHPRIYEMQAVALFEAASALVTNGVAPEVEVMLPLVAWTGELEILRRLVDDAAAAVRAATGVEVEYSVGTMAELPRACLIAGEIAGTAEFLSFGTNDLTQTTLGLSRDDVEGRFLELYAERGIIERSPFETIDEAGVGRLVELGVEGAREASGARLGVCGEHGGDPRSIAFFDRVGLDYVSCSANRVPIARLAAAQAAIASRASVPG